MKQCHIFSNIYQYAKLVYRNIINDIFVLNACILIRQFKVTYEAVFFRSITKNQKQYAKSYNYIVREYSENQEPNEKIDFIKHFYEAQSSVEV